MSERGEVVAWMHDGENRADVIHRDVKELWDGTDEMCRQSPMGLQRPFPMVEHYTIPLVRQSDYLALREELDALKARIAESAVAYWHKGRVKSSPLSIGMNGKAEVGQRVRLLLEES